MSVFDPETDAIIAEKLSRLGIDPQYPLLPDAMLTDQILRFQQSDAYRAMVGANQLQLTQEDFNDPAILGNLIDGAYFHSEPGIQQFYQGVKDIAGHLAANNGSLEGVDPETLSYVDTYLGVHDPNYEGAQANPAAFTQTILRHHEAIVAQEEGAIADADTGAGQTGDTPGADQPEPEASTGGQSGFEYSYHPKTHIVQGYLYAMGYTDLEWIDGVYGPKTKAAIEQYIADEQAAGRTVTFDPNDPDAGMDDLASHMEDRLTNDESLQQQVLTNIQTGLDAGQQTNEHFTRSAQVVYNFYDRGAEGRPDLIYDGDYGPLTEAKAQAVFAAFSPEAEAEADAVVENPERRQLENVPVDADGRPQVNVLIETDEATQQVQTVTVSQGNYTINMTARVDGHYDFVQMRDGEEFQSGTANSLRTKVADEVRRLGGESPNVICQVTSGDNLAPTDIQHDLDFLETLPTAETGLTLSDAFRAHVQPAVAETPPDPDARPFMDGISYVGQ